MAKREKIWWILFKMDPLGFIWMKIKDTLTYQEWVEFLCYCHGHRPLERFKGTYCDRCGTLLEDKGGLRFNVRKK